MSPDLSFLLLLAIRMAVAAAFVVTASIITERSGPVIGALIATLPVSAGPSYVFLALGSQGREEMTLFADQDNALLYEPAAPGPWPGEVGWIANKLAPGFDPEYLAIVVSQQGDHFINFFAVARETAACSWSAGAN